RSAILVNTRLGTCAWKQVDIDSPDITAICIETARGTILIYNIYNDYKNDNSLEALAEHVRKRCETREGHEEKMIWAGDFNRHHPMWEEERNNHLSQHQR
ncbi:Endonuclease/exonuclease/phosphatase, partial [Crepidotus variabilis]